MKKKILIPIIVAVLIIALAATIILLKNGKKDSENQPTSEVQSTTDAQITEESSETTEEASVTTEEVIQTNFTEETVNDEFCVYLNSNSDSADATDRISILLSDGKHRLIMCGLNPTTKELFPIAVNQYYSADSETPIKFIDSGFMDVEKYDSHADSYELSDSDSTYSDSSFCWAATATNALWMSGWAQKITDYKSEDDLFDRFTGCFINKGCDIQIGMSWLYTGENFIGDPTNYADCLKDVTPCKPELYGNNLIDIHSLAKNGYEEITCLEEIYNNDDVSLSRTFGMSLGEYSNGEFPEVTLHAVTPVGVIIDETATSMEDRYCAVLLADSDNDSFPSEELANKETLTRDEINKDKANRPNAYTLYPIKVDQHESGIKFWKLVGYEGFNPPIIMTLIGLCNADDEKTINEARETEGSTDFAKDPDLFIYRIDLTNATEAYDIVVQRHNKDIILSKFSLKEPMCFNITYGTCNNVPVTVNPYVKVTISKDNKELYTENLELDKDTIYSKMYISALIDLKKGNGASIDWTPGKYTATFEINPADENGNHGFMESYFKNNKPTVVEFEITE